MMDIESQKLFNEITQKDINDLTKDDIAFLKARRLYLTPAQRLAYQTAELNLFSNKKEEKTILDQTPVFDDIDVIVEDADMEGVEGVPGTEDPEEDIKNKKTLTK